MSLSNEVELASPNVMTLRRQTQIMSIDALRGFAIAVLLVATPTVKALQNVPTSPVRDALMRQLAHSKDARGISLFDVGWPAFLTIAGMALTFSLHGRLQRGETKLVTWLHLLRKSSICAVVAFFIHGGFSIPWAKMYFADVLYIYAATIFVSGSLLLFLGFRGVAVVLALLLIGFSTATLWLASSTTSADAIKPGALDDLIRQYVGTKLAMKYVSYFPRQLMSCLAGLLLARLFEGNKPPQARVFWLVGLGVLTFIAAVGLDRWIPINKSAWTTSYTLCTFGITCLFLAAFSQMIEVWGLRWFSMPWIVFGKNSLAAYAAHEMVPFDKYAERVAGNLFEPILGAYNQVFLVVVQFVLCWLLFYALYRRNFFIRLG